MSYRISQNETLITMLEKELPEAFYWLLIAIVTAIVWVVYLTYYNSRVMGLILTIILNRVIKKGHIKFGSFSFAVLSGKVMFRDVHYITKDYAVRIQLGFAIFRWWRPLTTKKITEDLSQSETRLSVNLDSFEWHVYNRTAYYSRIEKLFGLDQLLVPPSGGEEQKQDGKNDEGKEKNSKQPPQQAQESKWKWRDLLPVIKWEIASGRIVFGNYFLPNALSLAFRDTQLVYTTKGASTEFDQFMHYIEAKVENIRVMLVKSPKYQGPYTEEAPRNMGDGFVILQSNRLNIKYYFDEPGLVPYEPELVRLANGDTMAQRTWPCWGMDIKCHKGADISYGPWADRQREFLWKFFFPVDHQEMEVTTLPEPGQTRMWRSFDFKMCMEGDSTLDILFTKNTETQAVHMTCKAGSLLEFTIPYVTEESGYVTKMKSTLIYLDASTSLQFRSLLECETLEVDVEVSYPCHWNSHQDWRCDIIASKASGYLVFQHKSFFLDMVEDWSSKSRSDILHFVPYTWRFTVIMREFELLTLANEWNWIDCNGQPPENAHVAFCGDTFDMSFNLPFTDYLPDKVPIKIFLRGESVDCRLLLPETNTSRHVLLALAENMKIMGRDGVALDMPFTGQTTKKWRRITLKSLGWVDCWTTPIVAVGLTYTYHPMPARGDERFHCQSEEPISTPDAEEMLLIPLRLVPQRPQTPKKAAGTAYGSSSSSTATREEFDPTVMEPDQIALELEVGPSVMCVYGSLLRNLWHLKENYLGEDQIFTDYDEIFSPNEKSSTFEHLVTMSEGNEQPFDCRNYRPLHVTVQVTLHDIQAHLVKNCNDDDPPCPCLYAERLGFELDKRYKETRLQLLMSPVVLIAFDQYEQRPDPHSHLKDGHLSLSGLQVRGHAMFSDRGLPLDSETLEYAWLVEATIGDLTGKLTASQLQSIIEFLQTFVFLIEDPENALQRSVSYKLCQHMVPQAECTEVNKYNMPCPTSDDIKYRLTRATVDCVDLYLVEAGSALNIQIYPIRLSTCNLHGKNNKAGVTALIPHVKMKQFVLSVPITRHFNSQSDVWLEAGGVSFGAINVDTAFALPGPEFNQIQDTFLKLHDERSHRLWFLWPPAPGVTTPGTVGKCGCVGGCNFFGSNRNGPKLFHPSEQDFVHSINAAVFHICADETKMGFGQSLLQKGQLMFDLRHTTMPFTPSKTLSLIKHQQRQQQQQQQQSAPGGSTVCTGSTAREARESLASVESGRTSTTLVDPNVSKRSGYGSDLSSMVPDSNAETMSSSDVTITESPSRPDIGPPSGPLSTVKEKDEKETASVTSSPDSVPSDYIPGSSIPDAYDTDRCVSTPSDTAMTWVSGASGSVSSLPDFNGSKQQHGHERKHSYDPPRVSAPSPSMSKSPDNGDSRTGSVGSFVRRDSRSSLANSSGSRQSSLTSPVLRRLSSQLSVHKEGSTASMTGSEMFFSAAEDMSGSISTLSNVPTLDSEQDTQRIVDALARTLSSASDQTESTNQSLGNMSGIGGLPFMLPQPNPALARQRRDSSDSSSSTTSFASAISSQKASRADVMDGISSCCSSNVTLNADDDLDIPQATNYVDLHGQINQPITKSPLLMQCYMNHMTQLQCCHWCTPPPLPHITGQAAAEAAAAKSSAAYEDQQSTTSGSQQGGASPCTPPTPWIPQFAYLTEGFSPSCLVNKKEPMLPPNLNSPNSPNTQRKSKKFFADSEDDNDSADFETIVGYEDHVSKTTAIVNLKGSIDIMFSPLMLEALQRYVDAVTPVLSNLHPSAIVDALHLQCAGEVKAQNKLKQEQSEKESVERKETKCPPSHCQDPGGDGQSQGQGQGQDGGVVNQEDQASKTSRLQVMFSLSRINVCLLQASLVEEMISIAALEHVQELTCVSVLAVSLDDITCQLLMNNVSQKSMEAVLGSSDCSPDSVTPKKTIPAYLAQISGGAPAAASKKPSVTDPPGGEMEKQVVETQQEDMVGSLHIGRIHFQLRRMKKNSNYSDSVYLTAIPEHHSKVLFTFEKQYSDEALVSLTEQQGSSASGGGGPSVSSAGTSRGQSMDEADSAAEEIAGFIMFECGLEDITLRAARRMGYSSKATQQDEENLEHISEIFEDIKERTRFDETASSRNSTDSAPASREHHHHHHRHHHHHHKHKDPEDPTSAATTATAWPSSPGSRGSRSSRSHSGSSNDSASANSADDEASATSRVSIPSAGQPELTDEELEGEDGVHQQQQDKDEDKDAEAEEEEPPKETQFSGDASSCTLEFKAAWFNFAAPPPSPKKKKLEYTRFDWNLLSTVTPAINAWMNPSHWAIVSAKTLVSKLNERVAVVMACIMTEAMEMQGIHMPARQSRFTKITSLSKTLQEDPSCQLLTVLRRYISKVGTKIINDTVHVDTVPQLLTIQKGLLVLTRQWKTCLYMPHLASSTYKSKRKVPYTVAFTLPQDDSVDNFQDGAAGSGLDDNDLTGDNFEVVDEKTSLLKAEGGSVNRALSVHSCTGSSQAAPPVSAPELHRPTSLRNMDKAPLSPEVVGTGKSSSAENSQKEKGKVKGQLADSPIKLVQRSNSFGLPGSSALLPPAGKMHRQESNVSFASASIISMSSAEHVTPSVPSTPVRTSLMRHLSELRQREDEDLYRWMQRQQEETRLCNHPNLHYYPSMGQDSLMNTGLSEYSQDDSLSHVQHLAAYQQHPACGIQDSQVLFRPLLKAIGLQLEAVKMSALMKKFGGNISISGVLQELRIDIIDSETSATRKHKRGKGRMRKFPELFPINTAFEMPAFKCDTMVVMIGMKDIVDFEKSKEERDFGLRGYGRRKSLNALRGLLDQMEAKPTTTRVNFSFNCHSVSQHVNMSLLRLVYQFVTMIENINETRTELKGLSEAADGFRCHKKNDSKGSSGTATGTDVTGHSYEHTEASKPFSDVSVDTDTPTTDPLSLKNMPLETALQVEGVLPLPGSPAPETPLPRPDRLPLGLGPRAAQNVAVNKAKMDRLPTKGEIPDMGSKGVPLKPFSIHDTVIEVADTSSPALAEKTIIDEIHTNTPKCWRNLYSLLELYSQMPEMKTVGRRPRSSRLSVIDEEPEKMSQTHSLGRHGSGQRVNRLDRLDTSADVMNKLDEMERGEEQPRPSSPDRPAYKPYKNSTFTHSFFIGGERIPLVAFGVAKVKRIRISAMLSGLTLEADLQNVHASATHRERVKGVPKRKSRESSATAHAGHTMIVLLEGTHPSMQTVVTVNISKSQGLYSSFAKRSKEHNSGLVTIGKINVDIPQHPVVLHGMVSRGSKRLSSTLQEFIRPPPKFRSHDTPDGSMPAQQTSKHSELSQHSGTLSAEPVDVTQPPAKPDAKPEPPSHPLCIHFKAVLQGLTIGASLLPSLKAQYKMGEVFSSGVTGKKARFTVDLPTHSLSFTSKVRPSLCDQPQTPFTSTPFTPKFSHHRNVDAAKDIVSTPTNLPSSASIDLPPIHVHSNYEEYVPSARKGAETLEEKSLEELTLREGKFLNAIAEVGAFEHSLTTDLLNHLVFVQKVFMKEVNEVVQKVSGGDQPVPLWSEDSSAPRAITKPMLYHFLFRLKGIQITATTPTNNAVRLETGLVELELSNRVLRAGREASSGPAEHKLKVFLRAQVELSLALGTLMKNCMFPEADQDFLHLASFDTKINLRNALQDEMIPGVSKDQEALLISLRRPIIFLQPASFDRAVLVWLNYKNAYEYWNEQRMALNKEVQTATRQVIDKLPLGGLTQQVSPAALGTLFLQLTVDDLGICMPLSAFTQCPPSASKLVEEAGEAMVLTLERTQISACSCGSLVSKGKFTGFCLRFDDDFQQSLDDWKPRTAQDTVMNAMVVPEGTYEVCSRTSNPVPNDQTANAKWILNVKWQMRGIDVHLDTNIGKRLSVLGNTLTSLAGEQFDAYFASEEGAAEKGSDTPTMADAQPRKSAAWSEVLPEFAYDDTLDVKTRARLLEKEMNNQAKVVEDLKQLGASHSTVESEERKLQELEAAIFHGFRQGILNKINKQGVKAALKDQLGLGYKPSHVRSKSVGLTTGSQRSFKRKDKNDPRRLISYAEDIEGELLLSPVKHVGPAPAAHLRTLSLDVATDQWAVPDVSPRSVHSETLMGDTLGGRADDRSPASPVTPPYKRLSLQDILASTTDDEEEEPDLAYLRKASHKLTRPPSAESDSRAQKVPSPSLPGGATNSQKVQLEPSVDFELDIKVDIDSGKCVLHPKELKTDVDTEAKKLGKREQHPPSPRLDRKKGGKKLSTDSSRIHLQGPTPAADNTTEFFLPGVDVKVHYSSKTSNVTEVESPTMSGPKPNMEERHPDPFDGGAAATPSNTAAPGAAKKGAQKKANLYAWLSLQQLSEEMLISPVLLDFLEQALEPIPLIQLVQSKSKSAGIRSPEPELMNGDLDTSATSLVSTTTNAYASFPVDVVVYIRVQPSLVRFTCLPVSRVECLLRLPSVDVVFSTKTADVEANTLTDGTPPTKNKAGKRMSSSSTPGMRLGSTSRVRNSSGHHQNVSESSNGGGLSVTGCLADFSLYIFHPYGGGQKKTSLAALENSFRKAKGTGAEGFTSPLADTGRKDSLSLNVEFVKVNISRSRKGVLHGEMLPSMSSSAKLTSLESQAAKAANVVRFSAICDVGSASFKYDMRRLAEILALPKAWYRRTLARRMFLGEETAGVETDSDEELLSSSPPTPDSPLFAPYPKPQAAFDSLLVTTGEKHHRRSASADTRNVPVTLGLDRESDDLRNKSSSGSSPQSPGHPPTRLGLPPSFVTSTSSTSSPVEEDELPPPRLTRSDIHVRYSDVEYQPRSPFTSTVTPGGSGGGTGGSGGSGKTKRDWETLVLFAVKLSQLDVFVNMSNVMGNTVWSTKDLKSQGKLSIDSTGYKNMMISAGMGGSQLKASGGIVGGNVELEELNTYVSVKEDPGREPEHRVGVVLQAMEARLDYMGSSVLMGRISALDLKLSDQWSLPGCHLEEQLKRDTGIMRPAYIHVKGELDWDKFHLMISRSTTGDLLKMAHKLEEFFAQQLSSSKKVFSAFGPIPGSSKLKHKRKESEEASWISEIRHHRHWQKVLEHLSGCQLSMLSFKLPEHGSVAGGTMCLKGKNLSLACYHGINFRSKSWALFTMTEPDISFCTESQEIINDEGAKCTHVTQTLEFRLGHDMLELRERKDMAMVCKLSRGHYMPPPFTSVQEWFHYAFATSEVKDLDSFPQMVRQGVESPPDRRTSTRRGQEYMHDTEVIFVLPRVQLDLTTRHLQGAKEPEESDDKPVVNCSFFTQFEDHTYVAMDAEVILFLHDLVTNYVKEKDRGGAGARSPEAERKTPQNPTTVLKQDYRAFLCESWTLEPTVRLISWGGKKIDPVGVDFILQKLGFQHARLTIPKWMQRGCMDPLDKVTSVLVDKLVLLLRDPPQEHPDKDAALP